MRDGGDNETLLVTNNDKSPTNRTSAFRGSLSRPIPVINPSTYAEKKIARCNKGSRVKIRGDKIFHMLRSKEQKEYAENYGDSRIFFCE